MAETNGHPDGGPTNAGAEAPAQATVAPEAVRAQLERVLASPDFANTERGSRFLRFLVEETLADRGEQLKEYTLALRVFDRGESFDPTTNPAVRVEASRLRRRLEHYYLTQGRDDPILIELRRGSYIPVFGPNRDVLHLGDELSALRVDDSERMSLQLPKGPAIAVLPFENLNEDEPNVFSDGITVEIITALSRFREFHVLGRYTTFARRDTKDAKRVGRELGARYVLEGSVRRLQERIRVNAQLVNAADGKVLWGNAYERDLSAATVFDIEDDIANHVVVTIAQPHGVIARPELAVTKRKPPENLDTYDCILLFYEYTAAMTPERHAQVKSALEAARKREGDCSNVWAALSQIYSDTFRFGFNLQDERSQVLERALEAAQRAVKLDPHNPLAYNALFCARFLQGNVKAFREAGNRAVALNPNNTDILADYGLHLMMSGDAARGRLFMKTAMVLNPEPPDWYYFPFFSEHFLRGEYEEALDMALRTQNADFYWTHCMHAMAYQCLGMEAEAHAAIERLLAIYPDFAEQARTELRRWVSEERVGRSLDVLRAAGLPVPAEP